MVRKHSALRLSLVVAVLLVLSLGPALQVHAAQPVNTWFGHLIETVIASLPWTPAPAPKATAADNAFPNMDPNGLEDSSDTETFPNMDPNGLEDSSDTEAFPDMDPNG